MKPTSKAVLLLIGLLLRPWRAYGLTAALLLATSALLAQPGDGARGNRGGRGSQGGQGNRLERIEAARVAFLTSRLNLTTDQAQKFWPIYNEYDAKRRTLRKRLNGRQRDIAALADNQLPAVLDDMLAARQEELTLDKDYIARFQKVISTRQVLLLVRSEREFAKLLLRKLEERRGGGRPGATSPPGSSDDDDEN